MSCFLFSVSSLSVYLCLCLSVLSFYLCLSLTLSKSHVSLTDSLHSAHTDSLPSTHTHKLYNGVGARLSIRFTSQNLSEIIFIISTLHSFSLNPPPFHFLSVFQPIWQHNKTYLPKLYKIGRNIFLNLLFSFSILSRSLFLYLIYLSLSLYLKLDAGRD